MTKPDMETILADVDAATGPDRMSLAQALEFLTRLVTEIESRIDGYKDDLRNNETG